MADARFFNQIRKLIARDELPAALEKMRAFLANTPHLNDIVHHSGRFYYLRRQIALGLVSDEDATLSRNQIRFGILDLLHEIETGGKTALPDELASNPLSDRLLAADKTQWVKNLSKSIEKQEVVVGDDPLQVFQHYGWLVQNFLFNLVTPPGNRADLTRLSYMTEAWQASVRYLCYIQVAQVVQLQDKKQHPVIADFLSMKGNDYMTFDYLGLLAASTELIERNKAFIPEIHDLVGKICDTQNSLYQTTLLLHDRRQKLLPGINPGSENLPALLDEYLTALVFWLCDIAFLAKYRLVSIKDININYRIGTESTRFRHLFGELHGHFSPGEAKYNLIQVKGGFTFNQSVLLFKGSDVATCLRNLDKTGTYLSLSPFLIDQSVLVETPTQTPELYYFTGQPQKTDMYSFVHYARELFQPNYDPQLFEMEIDGRNMGEPKKDEWHEHIKALFKPFKHA